MAISSQRRRGWAVAVAFFAAVLAVLMPAAPALADPGTNDEGATQSLQDKLEQVATSYYDAKSLLAASQKRQAEITVKLRESQLSLARLTADVGNIAAARYKGSELGVLNGLFTGQGNAQTLLQGAAVADYLVWRDDEQLRRYREARDEAQHQQQLLDAELAIQAKALAELDTQKRAAEKALAAVGGMVTAGYNGPAQAAQPAPRNGDGSWPRESANINDPTSEGKITPRMYHALIEAQLAGFTRYTHCWRTQSWGEHPKGRACDFSATKGGFENAAAGGDDKAYGTRLAAWAMANAEALGVMYVIWYRQIWMPGIGWRAYSSSSDPSSAHLNHVHISIL
jgi:CHASE3 domain sensor protein